MASVKLMQTKDGKRYYRIFVSRGYGLAPYSMRWYIPDGSLCETTIQRKLEKVKADFERKCANGDVLTRSEQKQKEAEAAAEAAKLKTVKQYANGVFMPTKELSISENARASYRMFLDKHIFPTLGNILLVDVTSAMISKLLIDFQMKGYAHASAIKLYNILNGVFTMAYRDDSVTINPMLKVQHPSPRKDEQIDKDDTAKAYTVQELRDILSAANDEPLKWQAYIYLAADTGARKGELCGLQWNDINWTEKRITIRRNLQYTASKGVYVAAPKNGLTRIVDIGDDVLKLLQTLRNEQAKHCISQWVFTQDNKSDPMNPQTPTRYFKKFGNKYGIKDFHPHALRHTSASIAITSGADVVSVSQRLGHKDTAITLRMYAHANDESIRRAGQAVRDALTLRDDAKKA